MDLETENRLAAMLMEEARRLRQQAEREGVGVYLSQPKFRGRPNSRFLTATVLGVQQANRAVEVNEMWRAREKELELDRRKSRKHSRERYHSDPSKERSSSRPSSSSSKHAHSDFKPIEDDGLRDEDVEQFLQSRVKRGRGAIGSRMDEPGPYPICTPSNPEENFPSCRRLEEPRPRVLGPDKPPHELLEKASSRSNSVKVVDMDSFLKRRRRRHSRDVVSSSDKSSPGRMKKDKKQSHRRQSR